MLANADAVNNIVLAVLYLFYSVSEC